MASEDFRKERERMFKEKYKDFFLSSIFATKKDRKNEILKIMEPQKKYTIFQLAKLLSDKNCLLSRVTINLYLRELQLSGKISGLRKGLGGKLYFQKV